MARHRKLTQKFAGFPIFKVGTSGDTFPVTSPFTTEFTGYGDGLSLDLQFATDKTLTARKGPTPVFTRASSGRFVGSDGLIQSAGNNIARFDHDPVTLACKGLLIEESRTNAALYSGQLVVGTGWAANATPSVTSVVDGLGPDGNNAYEVAEIAIAGTHLLSNTGGSGTTGATSLVSGTNYTGSIFVKKVAGSVDWIQLTFSLVGFGAAQYANFNLSTGAFGNFAGLSAGSVPKIEAFANGWYRCSITAAATATTTTSSNLLLAFTGNADTATRAPSYVGSTANKVLAAMCQFEAGSFPTSYIPTTTASLARSADVCSITGSAFSNLWNTSGGTFLFEGFLIPGVGINLRMLSSGSNRRWLYGNQPGAGTVSETVAEFDGSSVQAYFTNVRIAVKFKIAISVEALTCKASFNGSAISTTNHNGNLLNSVTLLGFFETASGFITGVKYYRKNLANTKLQALST